MTSTLGKRMYYAVFMIEGQPSRAECSRLLDLLIKWAGMHKLADYRAAVWEYPTPGGLGGHGTTVMKPFTVVQPFAEAVPMEESYAYVFLPVGISGLDTYVEYNHFFMEIASCKFFRPSRILRELARLKFNVIGFNRMSLRAGSWPEKNDFS